MLKYLFLTLFILSQGCESLIGTRDAEDPKDDAERSLWQQPTSPDIVLVNMSNAFLERNSENYMRCLSDSTISNRPYLFFPDQEVEVSNPGSFIGWDLDEERLYINFMFSETALPAGALARLVFTQFEEPSIPSDTAVFEEIYDLQLEHEIETVPKKMRGIARFRMARGLDGNWSIYRWEDITFSSDGDTLNLPTWSEMKARAR